MMGGGLLIDQDGRPVGGSENPLNVEGRSSEEVLAQVLVELKKINLHLSVMSGEEITDKEIL